MAAMQTVARKLVANLSERVATRRKSFEAAKHALDGVPVSVKQG